MSAHKRLERLLHTLDETGEFQQAPNYPLVHFGVAEDKLIARVNAIPGVWLRTLIVDYLQNSDVC